MSHPEVSRHIPSVQIHLNSLFASLLEDQSKRSHAWFVFNEGLKIPRTHQYYLSLTEVALPVSWYVVNSTNNVISYTAGGTARPNITLTPGNWDAKSLAQFVSSAQAFFTVTYNPTNLKFTITPLSGSLRFPTGCEVLSISPMAAGTTTAFTTGVVDLAGTRSVFVKTNLSTKCLDSLHKGRSNILSKIPVVVESGQVLHYANPSQFKTAITETDVSVIEVFLLDEDHQLLDLNGKDWSMTLQFDVVERSETPLSVDKITTPLIDGWVQQQNTVS